MFNFQKSIKIEIVSFLKDRTEIENFEIDPALVTTKTKLGDFYAGTHSFTVKVEAYAIATTCVVVVAKKVWGPKCQSVGMYRLVFVRQSGLQCPIVRL